MLCKRVPARLISSFCFKQGPLGRPNSTIRHSIINYIPGADKHVYFKYWEHITKNELIWSILVNNLCRDDPQPYNCFPE